MRESKIVVVPSFRGTRNRDLGKHFLLTEWPAAKADDWGMRMVLAANRGGGSIPLDLKGVGMEGIAIIGINTFLRGNINSDELIPLWDELLQCVRIVRDPKAIDRSTGKPVATDLIPDDGAQGGDIQEVATRQWLRQEVLSLHLNFSVADALSTLVRLISTKQPPSEDSPSAPTSPAP
jgi:hypothetical protein